jgi:hypothetical protein
MVLFILVVPPMKVPFNYALKMRVERREARIVGFRKPEAKTLMVSARPMSRPIQPTA